MGYNISMYDIYINSKGRAFAVALLLFFGLLVIIFITTAQEALSQRTFHQEQLKPINSGSGFHWQDFAVGGGGALSISGIFIYYLIKRNKSLRKSNKFLQNKNFELYERLIKKDNECFIKIQKSTEEILGWVKDNNRLLNGRGVDKILKILNKKDVSI